MNERLRGNGNYTIDEIMSFSSCKGAWIELEKKLYNDYELHTLIIKDSPKEGWGVNYRVLKNTLCYIHPEKEALFIAFQMREVDIIKIKDSLSPYALKVWENRYPCGHGGWMWYHLTSLDQVEEVHLLLNTKIKPNK